LEEQESNISDIEFEILDNLYFLTTFEELKSIVLLKSEDLKEKLFELKTKGFIKILDEKGINEIEINKFTQELSKHSFLITKTGLLLHNSK
jgi:hypothetical protein